METDPGEKDKRALIVESEFARVLSVTERQGNTLSPIIPDAWDGKPLGTMTKTKAARCAGPHVSIIGHVTKDELGRSLTDTAVAKVFANRFLFAYTRRSKVLPFGGDQLDLTGIISVCGPQLTTRAGAVRSRWMPMRGRCGPWNTNG